MNCPKCRAAMETVAFEGIEVDRCTACKGLWFDVLEKEHLNDLKGPEVIDVGERPADAGDAHRRRLCPGWKSLMITMSEMGPPQCTSETSRAFFGTFFDAGEFWWLRRGHELSPFWKWS